jgi:hypothetical protein
LNSNHHGLLSADDATETADSVARVSDRRKWPISASKVGLRQSTGPLVAALRSHVKLKPRRVPGLLAGITLPSQQPDHKRESYRARAGPVTDKDDHERPSIRAIEALTRG